MSTAPPLALAPAVPADAESPALAVARWFRNGVHRLYVRTADGAEVGWVDLDTGDRKLAIPELGAAFEEAITRETVDLPPAYAPRRILEEQPLSIAPRRAVSETEPGSQPAPAGRLLVGVADASIEAALAAAEVAPAADATAPVITPPPFPPLTWTDLAADSPGQAARTPARQEPVGSRDRTGAFMTLLARRFDGKPDERSWRAGADGEESVGARLDQLRANGWQVLHSVPVGTRGSDIDHVLIGPGGVFVINARIPQKATVRAGTSTVMVGRTQPDLRNTRFEADRAAKYLSGAVGWSVEVTPVVVVLSDTPVPQVTIKDRLDEVVVLDRLDLPRYFRNRQPRLNDAEVADVFEYARRSCTWS